MTDALELMIRPFLACLILTGIHTYLGLHVVSRGVIFVDLALAQIAALGATVAFLFGFGLHSSASYFFSLAFTLTGAVVLALTRRRKPIVPQEALIGIVYAIAAAASLLVLSRSPDGGEELKSLLVGHLLFTDWSEIAKLLMLYVPMGILHWCIKGPLFRISHEPERARAEGYNIKLWDFIFYGTFGLVVTSSTELAGVLLVFSFLIVPAVCAHILADKVVYRLLIGWACGAITSVVGLFASYAFDLPTGAAVVCTFGLTLAACSVIRLTYSETAR